MGRWIYYTLFEEMEMNKGERDEAKIASKWTQQQLVCRTRKYGGRIVMRRFEGSKDGVWTAMTHFPTFKRSVE